MNVIVTATIRESVKIFGAESIATPSEQLGVGTLEVYYYYSATGLADPVTPSIGPLTPGLCRRPVQGRVGVWRRASVCAFVAAAALLPSPFS